MFNVKGSIVALITPFNEDGSVNFEKLGELIEWHIANKTDGIVLLGTTSESPTMTHEEDEAIVKFAVELVNKRVPLIASSGSNCTQTMIEKSLQFQAAGVDALLCISPYYNKANNEGMYRHFADVADAVDIPIILYNVPGRTGCNIPVEVVERLAKHRNIAGIKEASGNLSYAAKVARFLSDDFVMYSGNDDVILPVLSVGGSGVISVWANLMPETVHTMVMDFLEGRTAKAMETQIHYLDLINDLFIEVNPIPIKEAMNLHGMEVGGYRLPLCEMTEAHRAILKAEMEKVEVL
ncbi:MAG: 4-hydroxy-tetrahydrodipicolinate synthase [Anaerovoracaceae bacterium]|nr:4-hydroxy-tetrahydrodipicolinate synthase [Bacillota bacterium]MDY3954885.1 4-hydroxy-tetrahydrodipicolinate synthase [Anaerovoracaceae bacterium]